MPVLVSATTSARATSEKRMSLLVSTRSDGVRLGARCTRGLEEPRDEDGEPEQQHEFGGGPQHVERGDAGVAEPEADPVEPDDGRARADRGC